jgi:hypothetical protein
MLSTHKIANIIFNETQSLTGAGIDQARVNIGMTILNAQKAGHHHRPLTAPTAANVPPVAQTIYAACLTAAQTAVANDKAGKDPTNGATNFNFRPSPSQAPFFGLTLHTQNGPFLNSYPTAALPATGIYANTYGK